MRLNPQPEFLSHSQEVAFPESWYLEARAEHFWFEWRFRALRAQLDALGVDRNAPLRALDVGGGTGVLRSQLESHSDWTVDLADLNTRALTAATSGRGRTVYYDIHERRTELAGYYDVVVVFDVLEHLDDPDAFVASATHHLRLGGHLIVNVPALGWLMSEYDSAAGHLRRYSKHMLSATLAAPGLQVRDIRHWGLTLIPLLLMRKVAVRRQPRDTILRQGFRPPLPIVNSALRVLMALELAACKAPSLGCSLLGAAKRSG